MEGVCPAQPHYSDSPKALVYIPLPGHPVKSLRIPGKLNAVCSRAVSHELFHALPAVGRLVFPVSLADLPAHSPQHIGKAPRRQLAGPDGNCYGAPGNIFINQLYRLLSGGHLGTKCLEVPSIVPHAPY